MRKSYFLTFFVFLVLILTSHLSGAQDFTNASSIKENIEGLSIYPNPVSSGRTFINITSKQNLSKKIEFFNVLGKRIYSTNLVDKQLNITNLNKGVYILKITEGDVSETRKLVIK